MTALVAHIPVFAAFALLAALASLGGYLAARKDRAWALSGKARADAKNGLWRIEVRRVAVDPPKWSARVIGDGTRILRHSPAAAVDAALKYYEAGQGRES